MIYIRSIPSSSSQEDENEKEKALKLGEELLRLKHAERENNMKLLDLQIKVNKCDLRILQLKKEIQEQGGSYGYEEGRFYKKEHI